MWIDDLIIEYEHHRNELKKIHKRTECTESRSKISGMLREMSYVIQWMSEGRQPDTYKGADKKQIYHKVLLENADLIPYTPPAESRSLTEEEREALEAALLKLSPQERRCYTLHIADQMSMAEVAETLGITKSTVQGYITRAKTKMKLFSNL